MWWVVGFRKKFAEHIGFEEAERIDKEPPFILFQKKE